MLELYIGIVILVIASIVNAVLCITVSNTSKDIKRHLENLLEIKLMLKNNVRSVVENIKGDEIIKEDKNKGNEKVVKDNTSFASELVFPLQKTIYIHRTNKNTRGQVLDIQNRVSKIKEYPVKIRKLYKLTIMNNNDFVYSNTTGYVAKICHNPQEAINELASWQREGCIKCAESLIEKFGPDHPDSYIPTMNGNVSLSVTLNRIEEYLDSLTIE